MFSTKQANPVADNTEGYLVFKNPWPAMLRTIYGDPDRYVNQYWSKYPGMYITGDFGQARQGWLFLDHRSRG